MIFKIYQLCPSIQKMGVIEELDTLVKMCIAHVLNGNAYEGLHKTALLYLEELQ